MGLTANWAGANALSVIDSCQGWSDDDSNRIASVRVPNIVDLIYFWRVHRPCGRVRMVPAHGVNSRWRAFATTIERRDLAPAIPEFYREAVHKLSGPRLRAFIVAAG
jgi:hypothetical protein